MFALLSIWPVAALDRDLPDADVCWKLDDELARPGAVVRRKIIVAWKLSLNIACACNDYQRRIDSSELVLSREQLAADHAPNLVARSKVVLDSTSTGYLGALSLTPGRSSGRAINAVRNPLAAAALRSSL